jgi:phage terminase large subunit-like protein
MTARILPIAAHLKSAERSELVGYYQHYRSMSNEWIKRQVIDNLRIDILANILDLEVKPFHLAMLQEQFKDKETLILAFRGAGKSTLCTVVKAIHYLLLDPDLRIVIVSKTTSNAETFLREIKQIYEGHERFKEIFGNHYDPKRRWNDREVDIATRKKFTKEANITCTGPEGTVVGKHFDAELCDDLVDELNSRTQHMRDQIHKWYYSILDPTIEPPNPKRRWVGYRHRLGTRYHWDDQYGRWIAAGMRHKIITALNENGQSPWPEKWPPSEFEERKKRSGLIIFNAQFQCDTDAMKGEVFQFDDCIVVTDEEIPWASLDYYMGVDLAITEKENKNTDHFAIVVIGVDVKTGNIYVVDFFESQLRFGAQTAKIRVYARKHEPVRIGLETVAYQEAQAQNLEDGDEPLPNDTRLKRIKTDTDKIVRAWRLTPMFEDKRVHFRVNCLPVRDQLVLFPNYRWKDIFDAFDLAISAYKRKNRRKQRSEEPGVI